MFIICSFPVRLVMILLIKSGKNKNEYNRTYIFWFFKYLGINSKQFHNFSSSLNSKNELIFLFCAHRNKYKYFVMSEEIMVNKVKRQLIIKYLVFNERFFFQHKALLFNGSAKRVYKNIQCFSYVSYSRMP